jgi:rhodanese-related sulfurtransferase
MSRVGYDNALGYLKGGIKTWVEAGYTTEKLEQISAEAFAVKYEAEKVNILDVRRKSEFDSEHISGAENMPLDFIFENLSMVNPDKKYFIHCAGGYRSVIASSILQAKGFQNIVNIIGGFKALSRTNLPKSEYLLQKSML